MDPPHLLETLLQFLVTDASCVARLPYILDHLSSPCLVPSPCLQKWVSRVTSMMHSKDPAARWAAVCIAYRMSFLSKSLLVDNAQSWVGAVFPSLLKPEPIPVLRASMRYLGLVLSAAGHNLEFQRQVANPIVPKVSSALLTIAEKHSDRDIKTLSMQILAQLIPLYPSLHKALSQRLFALCNQIFSGSVHHTADSLLDAAARLYAVLPFLGGKVGGANLWRTCLDDVLQLSWSAWLTLRTTFPTSGQLSHKVIAHLRLPDSKLPQPFPNADTMDNPLTTVALGLDSLKCGISAITALLRAPANRPVRAPIGQLASFCLCLLASSLDDESQPHFDPHVRIAESGAAPQIWIQACRLLSCLAQTAQELLAPHLPKLIMMISSHLEKNPEPQQKYSFLRCASRLLYFCPVVGAALGINRLLKATISILFPLYLHQPCMDTISGPNNQSKAGKKRRREYEADNVLSTTNITICATSNECDTLVAALDVVDQCMLHSELVSSTRSLANRVLLSILLSLPSIPPTSLSVDPSFHGKVMRKARDICVEGVQGVSHTMSRSASLVLSSFSSESLATHYNLHSRVDLLLHPRRPPLVRTLPYVESLSLSSTEESATETATRHSLGLTFGDGDVHPIASGLQSQPKPGGESCMVVDQLTPPVPPQERLSTTSIELRHQTTSDANDDDPPTVTATSAAVSAMPDVAVGPPLTIAPKAPAPSAHAAPMSVDDSDHEEVPAIDMGSDSESDA